jgi:hypothetical protein
LEKYKQQQHESTARPAAADHESTANKELIKLPNYNMQANFLFYK